ncbi:hypothetical protein EJC47_19765 [Sphingomonas sp. TF3]|uniref:hypothetical protein n=1 Tax=Sphingomonas sp. TF3 TaxID=2495580 RepID=UPI000F86AF45|nr:hypothetical protein [Sphingomonas sp. TF3]RUN74795.1 hypothetical protein EJC47_19765 [Sphingomonas sp. TF3]
MSLKPVAVEGDVSPSPGTTPYSPAVSGAWSPGAVTYTKYDKLTVGGAKTVWQAKCTFSFAGSDANGVAVAGTSNLTLTAGSTKLQGGSSNVLLNGDTANDSYGNTLTVNAAGKLQSA